MIGGMKKAKAGDDGPKSMDRISDLPKEILHRILYFLSQKDAVRTSVLSKSWRYIWCTRPNLDFSDRYFNNRYFNNSKKQDFLSFVDKTLQGYSDQKLCVEEFRLDISLLGKDSEDHESVSLLENWIPRFTTMGVKEFCLFIFSKNRIVDLPSVVFKAESLKVLCLNRCNLGESTPVSIPFVRLQRLLLFNVNFIEKEIFDKIISSCPLLTTMLFQECKGLKTIKLEKKLHRYLKHFTFINRQTYVYYNCSIEIDVPTIEMIRIAGSKIRFHSHKLSNLKSLSLERVEICSNSIEQSQLICNIDAPNMENFTYSGFGIPSISLAPTLSWSKLELCCHWDDVDSARSWFLRLSKLLQALRHSEIFLEIFNFSNANMVQIQQDGIINGGGNYKPVVVEDLKLNRVDLTPSFLNGLFCICRPRNITKSWRGEDNLTNEREQKELVEYFCNIRERGNDQEIIWRDLEDLSIEGFDKSRREWQTLHGTTLLESAFRNIHRILIRFKWSEACESSSKPLES